MVKFLQPNVRSIFISRTVRYILYSTIIRVFEVMISRDGDFEYIYMYVYCYNKRFATWRAKV